MTATLSLDTVGLVSTRRFFCVRTKSERWWQAAFASTAIYAAVITAHHLGATSVASEQSELDRVLRTKVVKVTCPLDYAPFGLRGCSGFAFGIDVDAAMALALTLDASVVIVPSSWPTLLADFSRGETQIAIGGITPTLSRRRLAGFTTPYMHGGKVVIARCGSPLLSRFLAALGNLSVLNVPDAVVIVNPGGTNEHVARELLPRAQLQLTESSVNGDQFAAVAAAPASSGF